MVLDQAQQLSRLQQKAEDDLAKAKDLMGNLERKVKVHGFSQPITHAVFLVYTTVDRPADLTSSPDPTAFKPLAELIRERKEQCLRAVEG